MGDDEIANCVDVNNLNARKPKKMIWSGLNKHAYYLNYVTAFIVHLE